MDLRQFLSSVQHKMSEEPMPFVCFQGGQVYPLLFFSLFFHGLKKTGRDIVVLDHEKESITQIKMRLETSFLGMSSLYWLRSFSELDKKTQQQLLQYLREYNGPHTLMMVVQDAVALPQSWHIVTLPEVVDRHLFIYLMQWADYTITTRMMQGIDALYARTKNISLDNAVLLMHYFKAVGVHQQLFIDSWLDLIVEPDKSLFTLSQHFFAKDRRGFFAAWKMIGPEYPDAFWITFWSEQVWRAFYYGQLMRMQKITEAKKIAYRLPFSFIQRDWKKITSHELQAAHARLYALDYALKNGGGNHGFDLFYSQFFLDDSVSKKNL